jgi:hypothetical protein
VGHQYLPYCAVIDLNHDWLWQAPSSTLMGHRVMVERAVLYLIFPISMLLSGRAQGGEVTRPDAIEANHGVIFSPDVSLRVGVCKKRSECWQPDRHAVQKMEAALPPYLETIRSASSILVLKNLDAYMRKYYGVWKNGRPYIVVNGICSKYWKPNIKSFASPARLGTDLGECYFMVDYDVRRHTFQDLYIDGDA